MTPELRARAEQIAAQAPPLTPLAQRAIRLLRPDRPGQRVATPQPRGTAA